MLNRILIVIVLYFSINSFAQEEPAGPLKQPESEKNCALYEYGKMSYHAVFRSTKLDDREKEWINNFLVQLLRVDQVRSFRTVDGQVICLHEIYNGAFIPKKPRTVSNLKSLTLKSGQIIKARELESLTIYIWPYGEYRIPYKGPKLPGGGSGSGH